jgi:hypothetical protein
MAKRKVNKRGKPAPKHVTRTNAVLKHTERPTAREIEILTVRELPHNPKAIGGFVKGDPRINRTKPGPGRRTNRFKKRCARALENPKMWRNLRRALLEQKDSGAAHAWFKTLAAYGHGAPTQKVDVKLTKLEDLLTASYEKSGEEE